MSSLLFFFNRRRPQQVDAGRDPKQLSTSSHEAGDEYSSEASEIDLHNTVSLCRSSSSSSSSFGHSLQLLAAGSVCEMS